MIVSTKGRYALHVMTALAGKEGFTSLKEITGQQGVPHKYSENIMTALAKAGLVEGSRGKNGGYKLAREPKDYTLAEILRTAEPSFAVASCTEANHVCPSAESCPTLPVWKALDETVNEFLSHYTLEDIMPKA